MLSECAAALAWASAQGSRTEPNRTEQNILLASRSLDVDKPARTREKKGAVQIYSTDMYKMYHNVRVCQGASIFKMSTIFSLCHL